MKKYMQYRVEGRRPVGRPRKTWLESVEADMTEHEIDKDNICTVRLCDTNLNRVKFTIFLRVILN